MQKRIVHSIKELYDETSPVVFEKKAKKEKKKSLKEFIDSSRDKGKYIKGDPESIGKSEAEIEKEVEAFLHMLPHCSWWNMKIKGEIQSTGKGTAVIKESKNRGFPDFLTCIRGRFIGIEIKACARYQSPWQVDQQDYIQQKGGGFYFVVTSVRELLFLLTKCEILLK